MDRIDVRFTGKVRSMWRKVPWEFFDNGWTQDKPNITNTGVMTVIRQHWTKGTLEAYYAEVVPTF